MYFKFYIKIEVEEYSMFGWTHSPIKINYSKPQEDKSGENQLSSPHHESETENVTSNNIELSDFQTTENKPHMNNIPEIDHNLIDNICQNNKTKKEDIDKFMCNSNCESLDFKYDFSLSILNGISRIKVYSYDYIWDNITYNLYDNLACKLYDNIFNIGYISVVIGSGIAGIYLKKKYGNPFYDLFG